jgi:hypothetical protein
MHRWGALAGHALVLKKLLNLISMMLQFHSLADVLLHAAVDAEYAETENSVTTIHMCIEFTEVAQVPPLEIGPACGPEPFGQRSLASGLRDTCAPTGVAAPVAQTKYLRRSLCHDAYARSHATARRHNETASLQATDGSGRGNDSQHSSRGPAGANPLSTSRAIPRNRAFP